MRAVALLALVLSLSLTSTVSASSLSGPGAHEHTHRLVRRTAADTAGAVVGVLLFFLFVGFCWIMCQHPQWNPCGDCQCCSCCSNPHRPHPVVAFVRLGPAHWLWAASRGRWGAEGERPPDLEMQALGDDFDFKQPAYEARSMHIPVRAPTPSSHRSSHSPSPPPPPPPPAARIHRDRSRSHTHVQGLQVPERADRSHSRTRSEARPVPPATTHERTLSDPTDRAFADIFGEGGPRPAPPPLTRGREKAIERWRRTVAGG